jgi:hypothetical protein
MRAAKAIGVIAAVGLAITAIFGGLSARAEGPTLHISACLPRANGAYEDPNCIYITGVFGYERLGFTSTPQTVKSKVAKSFELEVEAKGIVIVCTGETSSGSASNPEPFKTTSGEGKATVTFTGCTVTKPSSCKIPGGKIVTKELRGVLEEKEKLGAGVKITPVSGTTLATVVFESELCPLPEEALLKGSAFGIAKNGESALEFTNESSSLTLGVSPAKLRGKSIQEDAEGNALLAEP